MASSFHREEDVVPKHWIAIYPAYINSKKTAAEGRRIPKVKGVENPTCAEILDILKNAGLNVKHQRTKLYPRDSNRDYTFQGRIRVELKNEEGQFVDEKFKSRESLMLFAADMIPKLKSRLQKGATVSEQAPTASGKPQKKKKGR